MKDQQLEQMSEIMKILSNPIRLKIIMLLFGNEKCVCNISNCLGLKPSVTSFQLSTMKSYNLVIRRKEKSKVYYKINSQKYGDFLACIAKTTSNQG